MLHITNNWSKHQSFVYTQLNDHLFICLSYLPNPSARAGYDTRSIFKQSLTGLNSEFSFSYLPIAGGRIIGFIPLPRVLVLCEMQSVSSMIWTRVAVSISYDNNHYTTGTSLTCLFVYTLLNVFTEFQTIQFSISTVFCLRIIIDLNTFFYLIIKQLAEVVCLHTVYFYLTHW